MKRIILLTGLFAVLAGCGGAEPPPAAPPAVIKKETVFDPLVGTIDRAKGVQQTLDDQAAAQRKQLDREER